MSLEKYTPKYFAKLSINRVNHNPNSCGDDFKAKNKKWSSKENIYKEMEVWANNGIWYAHFTMLSEPLQEYFKERGFNVYEYFGETGISWSNARWEGMEKFDPEKHLHTLESGDLVCGVLNGEGLNFYMYNKTDARIGNSAFTIDLVGAFINEEVQLNKIQKKLYWED